MTKTAPYTTKHGGSKERPLWRYKRRVPTALVKAIGMPFWVEHLGKLNGPQLAARAHALASKHDTLIGHLEAMTEADRAKLVAAGGLNGVEKFVAADSVVKAFVSAIANHFEEAGVDLKERGPKQDADGDWYEADPLTALDLIRDSKASGEAVQARIDQGEVLLAQATGTAQPCKLGALVDLWLKVSPPRDEKTVEKRRLYVKRFIECIGDLELSKITRQHVIKFRDALETERRSRSNIQAHLTGLNTLFKIAISEGNLVANPFEGVKANKRPGEKFSAKKRKHFTGEQVAAILEAADEHNFGEGRRRVPIGRAEDMRWIIRLLAYHGARSGEIVQLRPCDVTTVAGVPILRLTDEADDGSMKTENAVREVPIHPECMNIVARAVAMKGEPWLFMSFAKNKDKAHTFQHEAAKFLRETAEIADEKQSMHSLRHTWRTVAREIDMPDAVSRAIMGHSTGRDVHASYGGLPSLTKRALWIAKVDPLKA